MKSEIIKKYDKYSVAQLKKKAQSIFNWFIRDRDKYKPCISCDTGRVQNAGHYLSQGHHSALRYNEMNTNGQCIKCNLYLSGNLINYRVGLVKKIGEEKVKQLEQTRKCAFNWDRFSLIEIIEKYKNLK